ncbi:hypothetical protein EDC19_0379 [Natranaerovirga hydrolytica]|uniref:Uncharacterized protein n=1 Tax=Natranaerovirga hydrolytica TaxID=680378 RepID=A0A4R1N5S8_9FIRM|nr:hypothetical protein [Natranaerovirga hydrolytica]TCK97973.1 hypothetical protein EDC19_0379 [Natranaerovirga hydrolytica]
MIKKKIINMVLVFALILSNLSTVSAHINIELEKESIVQEGILNKFIKNVGVLEDLSLDGQDYNDATGNSEMEIVDITVEDSYIIIEGNYIEKTNNENKSNAIPFLLEGEVYRSSFRENVYISKLKDSLDNFDVVHFSINGDIFNVKGNYDFLEFELSKQFEKGFETQKNDKKVNDATSLMSLYLMNDSRDFIFMEELININLNLPALESLPEAPKEEEFWYGKIVETQGYVSINTTETPAKIERKLNEIPDEEYRDQIKREIENITMPEEEFEEDFSILSASYWPILKEEEIITTRRDFGNRTYYERIVIELSLDSPRNVNPTYNASDGDRTKSDVTAKLRIKEKKSTIYNNSGLVGTINESSFVVGRDNNYNPRDIEIGIIAEESKSSNNDKYFDYFSEYTLMYDSLHMPGSNKVDVAGVLISGARFIPKLSAVSGIVSAVLGIHNAIINIDESKTISSPTQSTNSEPSIIAIKFPEGSLLQDEDSNVAVKGELSSKHQSGVQDTRFVQAQFRYYVGNYAASDFADKYYTSTLRRYYQLNSIRY